MKSLSVVLFVTLLCSSVPAEAGAGSRRRAVRHPAPPPTSGACATIPLPAAGTKATYRSTFQNAAGTVVQTSVYTWEESSSSRLRTKIDAVSSLNGQPVGEVHATGDLELEIVGGVEGGLLAVRRSDIRTTSDLSGFIFNANFDSTYVPSLPSQPLSRWCEGTTWALPAITWTTTASGSAGLKGGPLQTAPPQTATVTLPSSTGRIFGRETITTPAGTFDTFKYTEVAASFYDGDPNNGTHVSWMSVRHGIPVKRQVITAAGAIASNEELVSLPLP